MEYYSYYGIEKYRFRRKISDFGVDFSYLQSFSFKDIFNHAIIIDHSQAMLVHWVGGGVAFRNSGHRLALGHVNNMRCLEKFHAFLFV